MALGVWAETAPARNTASTAPGHPVRKKRRGLVWRDGETVGRAVGGTFMTGRSSSRGECSAALGRPENDGFLKSNKEILRNNFAPAAATSPKAFGARFRS